MALEAMGPGAGFCTVILTLPTWALVAVPVAVKLRGRNHRGGESGGAEKSDGARSEMQAG